MANNGDTLTEYPLIKLDIFDIWYIYTVLSKCDVAPRNSIIEELEHKCEKDVLLDSMNSCSLVQKTTLNVYCRRMV